jgi:hypothetical protein
MDKNDDVHIHGTKVAYMSRPFKHKKVAYIIHILLVQDRKLLSPSWLHNSSYY